MSRKEVSMNTQNESTSDQRLPKTRDIIAALSSIVPGLGHIYKGHVREGWTILLISPLFIWAALILGFATAGFGLLVPVAYLIIIGWHAYSIEDKRRHPGGII